MTEHLVRGLACVVLLGVTAQWLATALRLPSILVLLTFGFIAGPVTGILDPKLIFGDLINPVVSLSVALILYEGGLSLRLRELRNIGHVVRNLVSVGAVVTWIVGAVAAIFCLGLYWKLSVLLGAILVVTGPTVIVPLLRHVRPEGEVGSILRWEGIVIDSVGAILAVLAFEAIRSHHGGGASLILFLKAFAAGGGIGLGTAGILYLLLKRYLVPDFLQNAVSLMMVLAAFSLSNMIEEESGVIAVTVMGIVLANQNSFAIRHIVEFKENLQVLLISSLFIILAASLDLEQLRETLLPSVNPGEVLDDQFDFYHVDPGAVTSELRQSLIDTMPRTHFGTIGLFLAVLIVIGRPIAVLISSIRSKLNWRERVFLAFMAPRGIVAAAVSSVFALRLAAESRSALSRVDPASSPELFQELFILSTQSRLLVPLTFIAIIATVSFYGIGAPLVASWLRLSQSNPQGVIIVGAHAWARAIAGALRAEGLRVMLADTNWGNWQQARMDGFEIFYGNILTEYSLEELDLDGIGRLLALTNNDEVNSLAALHFSEVFGRAGVYQLPAVAEQERGDQAAPKHLRGRHLFDKRATFAYLRRRWEDGARIKSTRLTEAFDYEAFRQLYGESALPLFIVDSNGRVGVITDQKPTFPDVDFTLISLVDPIHDRAEPNGKAPSSVAGG